MFLLSKKTAQPRTSVPLTRHARLFELLRQENLASQALTLPRDIPQASVLSRQVDPGFAQRAARSLRA